MEWLEGKSAPKGGVEERDKKVKTKDGIKIHKYKTWVAPRIIGCANLWTTETYWMPPEGKSKGRWHKFNEGVELDGYMLLPAPLEPKE